MGNDRDAAVSERHRKDVFQPSKAEIAEEMKRRLELTEDEEENGTDERPERPTADRH